MTIAISIQHQDGSVEQGDLAATGPSGNPPKCRIEFRSSRRDLLRLENTDFFECLIDLRRLIEKEGGKVLCQGARKDVSPSPMMRSSGTTMAYRLHMGRQAGDDDRVRIFDPAAIEDIVSVDEQRAYYSDWIASLGWEKSGDMWFQTDASKVPTPGEIEEARRFPNGSVSRLGKNVKDARGQIPLAAIEGFWRVDSEGRIFGRFLKNPDFKPDHGEI